MKSGDIIIMVMYKIYVHAWLLDRIQPSSLHSAFDFINIDQKRYGMLPFHLFKLDFFNK